MDYKKKYLKYKKKYVDLKKSTYQRNEENTIKIPSVVPDLYIGRDVAIIGNDPSLLESDHSIIDKHDYVIRINCHFLRNPFYNKMAGSKCDIFVNSFSNIYPPKMKYVFEKYKNTKLIMYHNDINYFINLGIKKDNIFLVDFKSFPCYESLQKCLEYHNLENEFLLDKSNTKYTTTGLIIVSLIMSLGIKPTLYGFREDVNKQRKSLSLVFNEGHDVDISEEEIKKRINNYEHDDQKHGWSHYLEMETKIINFFKSKGLINLIH